MKGDSTATYTFVRLRTQALLARPRLPEPSESVGAAHGRTTGGPRSTPTTRWPPVEGIRT